jgi:uncharacterized membrane protein
MINENINNKQAVEIEALPKPQFRQIFWALFSYLGSLVIFPFALGFQHPFIKHHIKQGFLLFLLEVFSTVLILFVPVVGLLLGLTGWLFASFFSLIGLINVCRRKYWFMPGSHKLMKYLNF